jgi:trimeric autotransporter adhesin
VWWKHILSIGALACFASAAFPQRVITTVAGTDWLFPGNGGPAANAPLSETFGLDLAVDRNGNYFIADDGNLNVMRVGTDGIINVVAGNGFGFVSGNGGLAVNAGLLDPISVAVDTAGNIYIGEFAGEIRKVTPDGIINRIAGIGIRGYGGDNGPALSAQLNEPYGLAVDSAGNLYIADTENNRIRKVDPSGVITTIAGTGQPGFSGDGGPAIKAQLNGPSRLALDSAGDLYFVDESNFRVRMVGSNGTITTVAGGGRSINDGVVPTSASLIPVAIALNAAGTLYIADRLRFRILEVNAQGKIQTIAGGSGVAGFDGDGGNALAAHFQLGINPALAIDSAGNVLVADENNGRIREITTNGIVNTIAGNGLFRFSGDGGPAASATLYLPTSLIEDNSGNIFFTEPGVERIRRVTPGGTISVYAGNGTQGYSGDGGPATSAALDYPNYLALGPNGSLYFTDEANCVIRTITTNGVIGTFAGTGGCGDSGDGGPASKANFNGLSGLDFDSAGDLIVSESFANRLRMISASGNVVNLAGNGTAGFAGDGGNSQNALVNDPIGVRFHNGFIYFADSQNNRVRSINLATSTITTVAGNGTGGYSGDGGPATAASLYNPEGVAFDAAGNMYIADTFNLAIRKVTPDGIISTFAGSLNATGYNDGGLATNAAIGAPSDVFVDSAGNVLFPDFVFDRVREVLTNLPSFQVNPTTLAFTAPAGSTPINQSVNLAGSITGIPFMASATSNGNWLKLSSPNGAMPASLGITVDPSALPAGSNQGTITINAPNATPFTQTVNVTLTTTAPGQPSLNIRPAALTFTFVQKAASSAQSISVSNLGGGSLSFSVTASTTSGGSWLSGSPSSGSVNAFGSTGVSITANPSSLAPGTYSGTVVISSANPAQSVVVPVTMTVSAVLQTILIPQTGLTFFAVQGGGPAPPQYISILNTGTGQMTFNITGGTLSGGAWLSAFPLSGESDASSPIVPQVQVDVNPGKLTTGIYYGTVQVNAPGADNSPQFVSIILNVLPPGANIGPLVQPSGLIFAAVAGGGLPGSQTVVVQNTGSNPVTFHSGQISNNGQGFFTSLPQNGTVTQAQPINVVIQPQTAGLAAGVYRGSLTMSFSDGSTRNIAIVLVLLPANSTVPAAEARPAASGTCTPTTLVPVFTLLQDGFSIPAGFPGQVAVSVIDDCANPMTTGNVTVSFSNGDPALGLISLKNGTWAATWTPTHNVAQVTVTATAQIPAEKLQGEVQIKGAFQTYTQPPVIGTGAIVNAASFAAQAPLAPGSLITLFGTNLAQGQGTASNVPLPLQLAGSSLSLAGKSAPLLFANGGQVNAIIPYGIAVNTPQQVVVSSSSTISVPQSVILAAAAPGIFTVNASGQGQGIIVGVDANGNQPIADAANPVKVGQPIVIYCTGLGEVNPAVPTGTAAPLTQISRTIEPISVSVGGVAADVLFSGLTPGFVGLYQVNATIPNGVAPGSQVPVTLTGAGQQSMPVTIAVE